jgi:hypothetical protein
VSCAKKIQNEIKSKYTEHETETENGTIETKFKIKFERALIHNEKIKPSLLLAAQTDTPIHE